MAEFILSDESINESGFRILTSGIDISQFKKNPQMLWNHHRSNWDKPEMLPIGIWNKTRKENGKLVAEPEFDMDDEFAAKVAKKVEKKHLRASSIGVRILEVSSDPKYLEKGQTRPTVTKCKLMEVSVVDLPRNGNALRLYLVGDGENDSLIELGAEGSTEKLNIILPLINSTNSTKMENVYNFLKLGQSPSEADVLAAITALSNQKKSLEVKVTSLGEELEQLKATQEDDKCTALVNKAIDDKKITESDRALWLNIAKNGYEDAEKALGAMKGFVSLSESVEAAKTDFSLNDADKYEKRMKADELLSWKSENFEEFERCENAYLKSTE